MRKRDAAKLARELMNDHGLTDWTFRFNQRKRAFGVCSHQRRTIFLSAPNTELNGEDEVRDTILHEISHALIDARHGHDNVWKLKAIEVGANPNRTTDAIAPPRTWVYECPGCGIRPGGFFRRPTVRRSCSDCSPGGKFNEEFLLRPIRNPSPMAA